MFPHPCFLRLKNRAYFYNLCTLSCSRATIIAVGIAGFAMARQSVVGNRAEIMRRKQSIRDFVIAEREAEDN